MLYALELFDSKDYKKSMREFINLDTDPTEVIKLFPELDSKPVETTRVKLTGKDLENALNALIEYLTELRSKIYMNTKSNANTAPPSGSQDGEVGSQRNITQLLELIDTTLLKCYLQVQYIISHSHYFTSFNADMIQAT